jgi:hypothetical protein
MTTDDSKKKFRPLFDGEGNIQIGKFEPNSVKLDPDRVREISRINQDLERSCRPTNETLSIFIGPGLCEG